MALPITIMRSIDPESDGFGIGTMPARIAVIVLGVGGLMRVDVGSATDVDFNVSLSEIYTSNLFLTTEEIQVNDLVTRINPGVDIMHEGNAMEAHLGYQYEALFYADNSSFNEDYHQLDSRAMVDLIGDELSIAGDAVYSQINVDPTKPQTSSNIQITGNRSNAFMWRVGPNWQRKLPFDSQIDADYRFGQVDYDNPVSQDVDSQEVNVELASDQSSADSLTYKVEYEYWLLDYETSGKVKNQKLTLTLRQEVTQTISLVGLVGSESDIRDPRNGDLSQGWWEVGSSYADGGLNILVAVGERYFGTTFRLNASQQFSRWRFTAAYSEAPGTSESFRLAEIPADPEYIPIPEPPPPGLDVPGSAARFIRKRADGGIGWQGHRSGANLRVWWDERRDVPGTVDNPNTLSNSFDSLGTVASYSLQLGSRTTTGVSASWVRRDGDDNSVVSGGDTFWRIAGSAGYQLGQQTLIDSSISYKRSTGNNYDEFLARIDLTRLF